MNLALFDPRQTQVDDLEALIKGKYQEITIGMVSLALGLEMPHGDWKAVGSLGDQSTKSKFTYPDTSAAFLSASHDLGGGHPSPADPLQTASFRPGETILVSGINFPPGFDLPVGIYRQQLSGMNLRLIPVSGETIRVSGNGAFSLRLGLPGDSPPGGYQIIPVLDPGKGSEYTPQPYLNIQVGE